jgi:hypothetical protein
MKTSLITTDYAFIFRWIKDSPDSRSVQSVGRVVAFPEVGGLHHSVRARRLTPFAVDSLILRIRGEDCLHSDQLRKERTHPRRSPVRHLSTHYWEEDDAGRSPLVLL